MGDSLVVQWLGLSASTAEGPGSVPGQGTTIPQATCLSQFPSPPEKKKKNQTGDGSKNISIHISF